MNIIILAGGEGTRMGHVDKAAVEVNCISLLHMLVSGLAADHNIVVVSPRNIEGLFTAYEDPPLGGPLAGIATGFKALQQHYPDEKHTAILAVDAPYSAEMLPLLLARLEATPDADAALTLAEDGWVQPLCAVWSTPSLDAALTRLEASGGTRNRPVKALLKQSIHIIEVPGNGSEKDYDTVAELQKLGTVKIPKEH